MRTLKYIGRRLLVLVPQLFLISIITFTLVRMLPGDPARLELGPLAPQEGVELLRHHLRLDEPLPQQYIAYLQRLLQGDFGRSWVNSSSVAQDLLVRAPAALERVFEAFYTTKPGGLGLGLSICRSIIETHNGRLWASPNVPRGAIFGFIAPAHTAATS
jgi:ABC-type dipeptide/oligopeptide/nickel transport system permease component